MPLTKIKIKALGLGDSHIRALGPPLFSHSYFPSLPIPLAPSRTRAQSSALFVLGEVSFLLTRRGDEGDQ